MFLDTQRFQNLSGVAKNLRLTTSTHWKAKFSFAWDCQFLHSVQPGCMVAASGACDRRRGSVRISEEWIERWVDVCVPVGTSRSVADADARGSGCSSRPPSES